MNEPPKRRMVRPPVAGAVRAKAARLKSGKTRSASSRAWLERQVSDPFAAEARAQGYRSRAAFKLTEIDDRFRLIRRGVRVIDLGCAPGGWLQVALERGAGQVVGVDLLTIDPIPPAEILLGDFTEEGMAERLIAALSGAPDLILSDMAPNTIGHQRTDHLRIVALLEAATDFAIATLKPGGTLLAKAFQGGETQALNARLKGAFAEVRHVKPKASRRESSELYLLARGLRR
ncbi:MAG TPA: RlmE family RNA methyltransferase [Caulobacteraceae bacterium]|nr:RlmE family RNA methyltransferase [Caulobacteraceae bacterium]